MWLIQTPRIPQQLPGKCLKVKLHNSFGNRTASGKGLCCEGVCTGWRTRWIEHLLPEIMDVLPGLCCGDVACEGHVFIYRKGLKADLGWIYYFQSLLTGKMMPVWLCWPKTSLHILWERGQPLSESLGEPVVYQMDFPNLGSSITCTYLSITTGEVGGECVLQRRCNLTNSFSSISVLSKLISVKWNVHLKMMFNEV